MIAKLINPGQSSTNFAKFSNEGGFELDYTPKKNFFNYLEARKPKSILVRNLKTGAMESISITNTSLTTIVSTLVEGLESFGYVVTGAPYVSQVTDGVTKTLAFYGDVEVGTLTLDNDATVAVTTYTDLHLTCDYTGYYAGGVVAVSKNGTSANTADSVYGTATLAAVKADLATKLSLPTTAVIVTDDEDEEKYLVKLSAPIGTILTIGGTQLTRSNCRTDFKA